MLKRLAPWIKRSLNCKMGVHEVSRPVLLAPTRVTQSWVLVGNFHTDHRHFAKSKNIKKDKKKSVYIDENELEEWLDKEKLFGDLSAPLELFKRDLIDHTTLRTAQGSIENLKIEFEGRTYTLQDLADIGKKNPKLYVLDFAAFPQTIPTVLETLQKSHMNVNVQQDGTKVFIPIPKVTREHREMLAKRAKVFFVKCKDSIREVQLKYGKKLKTADSMSEETLKRLTNQVTALADKNIHAAEEILKLKENELLKIE